MLAWAALILLLQDPLVAGYMNRICHRLTPAVNVRFQAESGLRARPEPGGRISVSAGIFNHARNEAELAGVLAHEIAHANLGTPCIRLDKTDSKDPGDRDREHAADQTAIPILMKAGYNPAAMLEFFSRYRRENLKLPQGYSTEDLLLEKLQLEATDHPMKDAITNTPEFDRIHSGAK